MFPSSHVTLVIKTRRKRVMDSCDDVAVKLTFDLLDIKYHNRYSDQIIIWMMIIHLTGSRF